MKKKKESLNKWVIVPVVLAVVVMVLAVSINLIIPPPELQIDESLQVKQYQSLGFGTHPGAPVTLVEFVDYQCPFCKEMHPKLKQLRADFKEDINYVWVQAPNVALHPQSAVAAVGAICAQMFGISEEYGDTLFDHQDALEFEDLKSYAESLGIDGVEFHRCMASDEAKSKLEEDLFEGEKVNIRGTPTIFINGVRLEGIQDYRSLNQLIGSIIEGQRK